MDEPWLVQPEATTTNNPRRYTVVTSVEAWQWDGTTQGAKDLMPWVKEGGGVISLWTLNEDPRVFLHFTQGSHELTSGDYVVKVAQGDFITMNSGSFQKLFRA